MTDTTKHPFPYDSEAARVANLLEAFCDEDVCGCNPYDELRKIGEISHAVEADSETLEFWSTAHDGRSTVITVSYQTDYDGDSEGWTDRSCVTAFTVDVREAAQ